MGVTDGAAATHLGPEVKIGSMLGPQQGGRSLAFTLRAPNLLQMRKRKLSPVFENLFFCQSQLDVITLDLISVFSSKVYIKFLSYLYPEIIIIPPKH